MKSMDLRKKRIVSDISLIFVAAVWGGGFVAVKDALGSMTPMMLMAIRFIMASLILYVFLFKFIGKISLSDIKKGGVVGVILYLAFAAQTLGLQYTTASKQGFLTATYVVIVPFLYWILHKRLPPVKAFIGSIITIIGIALISLEGLDTFTLNRGDTLTLVCALFFAMHILSIEYYAKAMNTFKLAFVQIGVAAILFVVTALIAEPIPQVITPRTWWALLYMSFFSTFFCFTVQTVAQKYTTSSHTSIILSFEAVFAALFGVMILKETLSPMMLWGCLLIFTAILIVEVDLERKKRVESKKG